MFVGDDAVMGDRVAPIEQRAARLGVVDALVFRRLTVSTWAHLGGVGRGRGWAGLVDVDAAQDPLLAQVPAQAGGVHRFTHDPVGRVLGPYYACGGAVVRVTNDVVVVLGNPDHPLTPGCSPEDLRGLAEALDAELADVAPSKRLADELEILHAVRAVTTGTAPDLTGTLEHILDVAMQALACEVGLLRDGGGNLVSRSAWPGVDLQDPAIRTALDVLQSRSVGGSLCLQDIDDDPALVALGRARGVHSLLALAIPAPVGGVLVVAHTRAGPRGFTTLCRQLGAQVVDAASVVAHTAGLREELRMVAREQSSAARRDALTGLGNRLRWDEAVVDAQEQVDQGAIVTVITLDVDGLKQVNDTCGHQAGDQLLRRCAELLREHSRDGDVVVRLGGDEFAMLLPVTEEQARKRLDSLRGRLSGVTSGERVVAASLGAATTQPGVSVADAAREADAAMYHAKRSRRGLVHSTEPSAFG
jgi:diguanylate cyclase (GGDEF)-like protein